MNNINYRQDQLPIIKYENGTMAVPAVPGAGKTFIVTNLVAKLLKEKRHEKSKILILTYMNSAVNNFKGRIKNILRENDIKEENSYEVMTIHSLAVKIIKEKPEIVMLSDEFNIADDLQKSIILNECINNFKINGGQNAFLWFLKTQNDEIWRGRMIDAWEKGFYDLIANAISDLKYKEISPDRLDNIISSEYKGILKLVKPIYKDYEKKLKQNGLLDYDDILILAYRALSIDEALRFKFKNKYKYIFEDECQDSNEIQGNIIKLISKENNNLVRVGDINQSITGTFSSSDPRFFKKFISEASNCYRMDMSNRSSKDILDLANRLVEYVTKEFNQEECRQALEYMKIKSVPRGMGYKENPRPDMYSISVKKYQTWEEEIIKTVTYTKGIKRKYPDKSIGILVPFNDHITQIANILIDENMEFEELGPNSLSKRKVIDNIAYIIDFIMNCDDINKLINVLDNVFIDNKDNKIKNDLFNAIRNYTTEEIIYNKNLVKNLGINDSEIELEFLSAVKILNLILEYSIIRLDILLLFIADKLKLEKEDRSIVDYLSFYIKFLSSENPKLSLLDVYNILIDTKNKVFNYIIEVAYEINGYEPQPGSITICNYHKSKGLEWDCVFLLGLSEFNFPDNVNQKFQGEKWYLKENYKNPVAIVKSEIESILTGNIEINYIYKTKIDLINEKIRLLYVGITRAKEMLILSCSIYNDESEIGKINKKRNPSLYINELEKYITKRKREVGINE